MLNRSQKIIAYFHWAVLLNLFIAGEVYTETLTLTRDQRPQWLRQEGIVMAGSWEPLLFRVIRDGGTSLSPTPEQQTRYEYEHSPDMIVKLKDLGVNFIMMHCYKGAGLRVERESMADAVAFAQRCREAGLHVGVYTYSGAFLWAPFFEENPAAQDWLLLNAQNQPNCYDKQRRNRYYWNRNHPDAQAFYKNIIRFAIEDVRADLIHFDNYHLGPGYDKCSIEQFQKYLENKFTLAQREEMGVSPSGPAAPPGDSSPPLLQRAWLDYACQALADSYHDMARYARSLRPDVLVECNPMGLYDRICPPVDHSRLITAGEAFWHEDLGSGFRDGKLQSRIRTYKLGRLMNNMIFDYVTTLLDMAESMAFNFDCLGCVCWFEYGDMINYPGLKYGKPLSPDIFPFIKFYHSRRDLLRDAEVVADVAILRNFASQVFALPQRAALTNAVEQMLIEQRLPFQIIYDGHLNADTLRRYKVLILAGCIALSDSQIDQVKNYVRSGGQLCIIGDAPAYDSWLRPREKPVFDDPTGPSIALIPQNDNMLPALLKACRDKLSLSVKAPQGLCAELTRQSGRCLVHLVNYRPEPVENVYVSLHIPDTCQAASVSLVSPEHLSDSPLTFKQNDKRIDFTVPRVGIYEIAVVTLKKAGL